jgi:putative inorganic carbon (HCO3(-)) transporter
VGLGASLALTTGVILLAQSRAAWLALAFGLLAGVAIVAKRLRPVALVLLVAGLVALVAIGPVDLGEWLVQQRLMTGPTVVSWEARVELWSRALWTLADFPLTGTGMNMFRRVVWQLYPLFHFPQGADVGHAHNIFLQAGLDLGLPGLICYLALWGGILAWGWKAYRSSPSRLVKLTILGSVVGLAVHAAWGLLDVVALGAKQNFLWWAMAALAITASVQDRMESLSRAG